MTASATFPIEKIFPKQNYRVQCKENPNLIPLFLSAHRRIESDVVKQAFEKSSNYQDPKYGLSPLTAVNGEFDTASPLFCHLRACSKSFQ